jgi:hypothetical protein
MASNSGDIGRSVGVGDRECGGVGGSRLWPSLGEGSGNGEGMMTLSAGVEVRDSTTGFFLGGGGGGGSFRGGGLVDSEGSDIRPIDPGTVVAEGAIEVFLGIMLSIGGGIPMRSRGDAKSIGPGRGRLYAFTGNDGVDCSRDRIDDGGGGGGVFLTDSVDD